MNKRKQIRTQKIYQSSDSKYRPLPQIKISNKWLHDYGFYIGDPIQVKYSKNQIIITKLN